jgi:hypothetical protein
MGNIQDLIQNNVIWGYLYLMYQNHNVGKCVIFWRSTITIKLYVGIRDPYI